MTILPAKLLGGKQVPKRPPKKDSNPAHRRAELRFASKAEFLKHYLPDIGIGGLQWVTGPLETGTLLDVSISFIGHTRRFILGATVVWKHSAPPMRPELSPGVGIEFDAGSKDVLREMLKFATFKEDESVRARDDRRHARIRVQIDCQYLYQNKLVSARVMDISDMGMYIATDRLLPEGTHFVFYLLDDHVLRPLVMEGVVVWSSPEGEKSGFGVQLVFDSRKHQADVKRYIASLGEAFEET
jgi:Tfp pilus assembly protein PilZ